METPHQANGPITEAPLPPLWYQVEAVLAHLSLLSLRVQALEGQVSDLAARVSRLTGLPPGHRPFVQVVGEHRETPARGK